MDGSPDRGPANGSPRSWPLVGAIVLLAGVNVLNNVAAPGLYLLWGAVGIAGLALLARADGLHRGEWGLGRVSRRAAVATALLALVTAGVMVVGTRMPGVAPAYLDERVSGMTGGQVAFAALVRAPFGTALFEEVAFRGVLLAMLVRRSGAVWAVTVSSLAFGIWHVVPALGIAAGNAAVGSVLGSHPGWAAGVGVLAAGLAGAFLCWLKIRYDHLLAPLAVHATATSSGYLLAWLMAGA